MAQAQQASLMAKEAKSRKLLSVFMAFVMAATLMVPHAAWAEEADQATVGQQENQTIESLDQAVASDTQAQSEETRATEGATPEVAESTSELPVSNDSEMQMFSEPGIQAGDGVFESGTGTQAEPFVIKTVEQLKGFAASVNAGNSYKDKYVELGGNIELDASEAWVPIGAAVRTGSGLKEGSVPFEGTFDGRGATVSNLHIVSADDADQALGLFGAVNGGTVKNLVLENVNIDANASELAGSVCGVLLAGGTVSGCTVSGSVKVADGAGVVGRILLAGSIADCANNASVTSETADKAVAGIVSKAYYTATEDEKMFIHGCVNTGEISGTYNAGGIVGLSAADVNACSNTGKITASAGTAGGIVGEQTNYGVVSNSVNEAAIEGQANAGGIVGWIRYQNNASYTKNAPIQVMANTNKGTIAKIGAEAGALGFGGIAGEIYNAAIVSGNENYAPSIAGGTFAAGIAGGLQTSDKNLYYDAPDVAVFENLSTTPLDKITASGSCTDQFVYNNDSRFSVYDNAAEMQASIGDATYVTLSRAIESAEEGQTVTLLADVLLNKVIEVKAEQNITLDLAGKKITVTQTDGRSLYAIDNYGTLTLKDSSDGEVGSITARGVENYGTMYLQSGTIDTCDSNGGGAAVWNEGSFEMTGGTLKVSGEESGNSSAMPLTNAATEAKAVIAGGSLMSPRTSVMCNDGEVAISNVTLTGSTDFWNVVKANNGTVTLSGVTINAEKGGGVEAAGGTVNINDCTFTQGIKGNPGAWNSMNVAASNGGTANIDGGTYTSENFGLYIFNSGGTINVKDGTFAVTGEDPVLKADVEENGAPSVINVSGGTFTGGYGIAAGATLAITGGTFSIDPTVYVSEGCDVSKNDQNLYEVVNQYGTVTAMQADGTVIGTYSQMKDALEAVKDYSGAKIECEAGKRIVMGSNHPNVYRSLTIEGNGATMVHTKATPAAEQTFSIESYASLLEDTTLTINNLNNATVWGQRSGTYGTDKTFNLKMDDCDSAEGFTGQRVYISGASGINKIELTNCDFANAACSVYSNAAGSLRIDQCSFANMLAGAVNIKTKAESGSMSVDISNTTFADCGIGDADSILYAAPVRMVAEGDVGFTGSITDCTFTYSDGKEPANGDILIGEGRVNEVSNLVNVTVSGTKANAQIQKSGDRPDADTNTARKVAIAADETVTLTNAVAQVGETAYTSLEKAIAKAGATDTVKLLGDITQAQGIIIEKDATIDLNGKTFTVTDGSNANNRGIKLLSGHLTITNGTMVADGKAVDLSTKVGSDAGTGLYGMLRAEGGTLDMENVTLKNSRPWGLNVKLTGPCKANLTNVTIESEYGGGIEVAHAEAEAVLKNCTFTQKGYYDHASSCVSVSTGGKVTVDSGTYISEDGYALYVFSSGGTLIVNDGTFEGAKNVLKADLDSSTYPNNVVKVALYGGNFSGNIGQGGNTEKMSIDISGGYFTSDPSAYVVEGMTALPSDAPGYVYMVGERKAETAAKPVVVEPEVTVDPDADLGSAEEEIVQNVAQTQVEGLSAHANAAVEELTKDEVEAAEKALEEAISPDISTPITVFVQAYLDIKPKAYIEESGAKALTLDITPMTRVVSSTADKVEDIVLDDVNKNAVVVGEPKELEVKTETVITVPLPAGFVSSVDDAVYAKHVKSDGTTYTYKAVLSEGADGNFVATFTNPHGFSEFTVTTNDDSVAQIDGVGYPTLQAAVDAVADGQTIKLLKNASGATVSKAVSFTLDSNGFTAGAVTAGEGFLLGVEGNVYTVTARIPIASVALDQTSLSLKVGATGKLIATVSPADTTEDKTVTWSSSNTAVATVSADGTVKAVKAGSAAITATVGGKSATCEVIVKATKELSRLGGDDRYATMALVSKAAFPEAGSCPTVIVARGDNFPDALAAAGLAGVTGGQVLLTETGSLTAETKAEIKRLGARRAYVIGDEYSVTARTFNEIRSITGSATRLGGENRLDTAVKIYQAGKGGWGETAVVATGKKAADSLSVSPIAYALKAPIFLADDSGNLPASALDALAEGGFKHVIVLGDRYSVSDAAYSKIKAAVGSAERIGGADRYITSQLTAERAFKNGFSCEAVSLTAGREGKYADALVASSLGGRSMSVLLLVDDADGADVCVSKVLAPNKDQVGTAHVLGDKYTVSDALYKAIQKALA